MSKQAAEHLTTRGKKHPVNKNLKGKKKQDKSFKGSIIFVLEKNNPTSNESTCYNVLKCFKSHNASGFLGEAVDLGKEEKLHCELHED